MFLQPKKIKYKNIHKNKLKLLEFKTNTIKFGDVGLKSLNSGTVTSRQIEAARQAINRKIKRKGKVWVRIFPSLPITRKPTEARMGKGKGSLSHWAVKVKSGSILFEICGISNKNSITAFKTGGAKLPVKTGIVFF